MTQREYLIRKIRESWPDAAVGEYPARHGYIAPGDIPPVRDGGLTERLIEHAVDTVLASLLLTEAAE
jgi:hypothetical protein